MIRSQTFHHDLYINQGASFSAEIYLEDNDGQPFDLTDYDARSVIKQHIKSETISAAFDCTIDDYLSGIILISLTPEQTDLLEKETYLYDMILENVSGTKHKVMEGIVYISRKITE